MAWARRHPEAVTEKVRPTARPAPRPARRAAPIGTLAHPTMPDTNLTLARLQFSPRSALRREVEAAKRALSPERRERLEVRPRRSICRRPDLSPSAHHTAVNGVQLFAQVIGQMDRMEQDEISQTSQVISTPTRGAGDGLRGRDRG